MYKSKCLNALLLVTITSVSLTQAMKIDKKSLFIPKKLGNVSLHHDKDGFQVKTSSKLVKVQPCYMDKELRGISKDKLARFLAMGGYLAVNKMSNSNDYSLKLQGRVKGGGVFGAWLGSTLGYGVVTFAGHGVIHLVALCSGPAYVPVAATLTKMLAIPIHTAATAVGVAGGVTVGVATGIV